MANFNNSKLYGFWNHEEIDSSKRYKGYYSNDVDDIARNVLNDSDDVGILSHITVNGFVVTKGSGKNLRQYTVKYFYILEEVKQSFLEELNYKISPNSKTMDYKVVSTAKELSKKILETLSIQGANCGKYGTLDEYGHLILRVNDIENLVYDLGVVL